MLAIFRVLVAWFGMETVDAECVVVLLAVLLVVLGEVVEGVCVMVSFSVDNCK